MTWLSCVYNCGDQLCLHMFSPVIWTFARIYIYLWIQRSHPILPERLFLTLRNVKTNLKGGSYKCMQPNSFLFPANAFSSPMLTLHFSPVQRILQEQVNVCFTSSISQDPPLRQP